MNNHSRSAGAAALLAALVTTALTGPAFAQAVAADANTGPLTADTTADPPIEVPAELQPPTETVISRDTMTKPDGTTVTTTVVETTHPAPSKPLVGYKSGFFIQSPEGPDLLRIGGQLQTLYTYQRNQDEFQLSRFQIRRARIKMKGTLFSEAFTFGLSLELGEGDPRLKDYWTNYAFKEDVELKVGQFKRPYDRQEMTSSTRRLMAEKAITNKEFGAGRDIGLMLHNHEDQDLEYALAFLNGTGDRAVLNVDKLRFSNVPEKFKPQAVFRLGYNQKGVNGYDESDLEGGPPRLAAAVSGLADFNIDEESTAKLSAEADAIFKAYGLSVSAALFIETMQSLPTPTSTSDTNWTDQEFNGFGTYIQAGYVIDNTVQPALRLAVDSLKEYAGAIRLEERRTIYEASFGLNVYFYGQNLKWLNQGRILFAPDDKREYAGFSMLAMAF